MAQPWTESAPIDFGKFAESAIDGANKAQEQLAEQSKSFSDLLIKNIDDNNKNRNTLQAIEMLNSLDVDSSKALLKSGNIMNSIAQSIGTNHINFNDANLLNALTQTQKNVVDNDREIMKDMLTTEGNEHYLKEDPMSLRAMTGSTLSISEIIKQKEEGKKVFSKRALNKKSMDITSIGKSPTAIRYELLEEFPGMIDTDTLTDDKINNALLIGKQTQGSIAVENGNNELALMSTSQFNPDGTPKRMFTTEQLNKHVQVLNALGRGGEVEAFKANLASTVTDAINRSGKGGMLEQYNNSVVETLAKERQRVVNTINTVAPGASYLMPNIFQATLEKGNVTLDNYLPSGNGKGTDNKYVNNFRIAYNHFNGFGLNPAAFEAILQATGLNPSNYKNPQDLIEDLDNTPAIKSLQANNHFIVESLRNGILQYKNIEGKIKAERMDNLLDIYNAPKNSIVTALVGTSNPSDAVTAMPNSSALVDALGNTVIQQNTPNTWNFDLRKEYLESPSAAYVDHPYTSTAASLGSAGAGGWAIGKLFPAKYRAWGNMLGAFLGYQGGGKLHDLGTQAYYGDSRYKFSDIKLLPEIQRIEESLKKGSYTADDIRFIQELAKGGGSLSPEATQRINKILTEVNKLKIALNSKSL